MTQDELMLLATGKMPPALILTPLLDYLRIADADRDPDEPAELMLLCERQGLEYGAVAKMIYRFRTPDCTDPLRALDFNVADKLLCGANLQDLWRGDLIDYYYAVDLSWKRCECDGCETMFQIKTDVLGRQVSGHKYCSSQCSRAAYKLRTGRTLQRLPKSRRRPGRPVGVVESKRCRNGHDRTPENTKYRGNGKMECLICHRRSSQRAYARRQAAKRAALVAA